MCGRSIGNGRTIIDVNDVKGIIEGEGNGTIYRRTHEETNRQ